MNIYNKDPYPPRTVKNDFRMQPKPRVPPFRDLPNLLKLSDEKIKIDENAAAKAKKKEENGNQSDEIEDKKHEVKEDMKKYEILNSYDFPTFNEKNKNKNIVNFDVQNITLFEIFETYGTVVRPKENPKYDPKPPPPKEKKSIPTPIPKPKVVEEGEDGEAAEEDPVAEEEPEEEPFIAVMDRELYYDFSTHNGKDPILLALMIKGENDKFTL